MKLLETDELRGSVLERKKKKKLFSKVIKHTRFGHLINSLGRG